MKRLFLSCTALAVGVAACAPAASRPTPPPRVNADLLISAEQLAARVADPQLVVLHVARERSDYDAGHLPGAHFLPLRSIVEDRDGNVNELPPVERLDSIFESVGVGDASRVVVYGDLGGLSAARAFFTLDYLGHPRVAVLDGGLAAWRLEERPVSTQPVTATPGTFTPRPQPYRVVHADWVRARTDSARFALVDARPPAEYTGETPGAGITRPGHLPGARNLFWRNTLLSEERPVLRTPRVLRGMLRLAGVEPGRTVVVYCRTGVQASHLYFVSRYLGYETRIYDASYADWNRRPDYPVVRGAAASDSVRSGAPR
ncbi:MAG: sulfurtransferase [Gemmatimonadota bacterium]|nr:sulfurtransferase [Gemmatimonadota bacterium]